MTPREPAMRTLRCTTAVVWLALAVTLPGCALKRVAMNSVADSLSRNGDTFAADNDPELIRAAVPFSLKLVESLLVELPRHHGLLLTACSGFTQYAYAFVESDAEYIKDSDYRGFERLQDRSRTMYLRARDYCLRGLELKYPGIEVRLASGRADAATAVRKADVPLLYWTAAAWGKAVAISLDRPALMNDLPAVRLLLHRALDLDASFNRGALHDVMIAIESVPEAMGGSPERARAHFERSVALSNRQSAGPYVTFARSVLLPAQQREAFVEMLMQARRIDVNSDPSLRLANILAQQQAQFLLDHLDDLFLSITQSSHP
jgi:predicted anti-sigma-YlaC factor YlaD